MPAIIPKETIEEIKLRCDIADIIGSYFNLQRASGSSFKALCPFHKEKTPSFNVNVERQMFHCFGCDEGGDVVRFVMLHEGVDFLTAIKLLAQRAGITLQFENDDGQRGPAKDVLYAIHADIAQSFQRCLLEMPNAAHARDYVKSRGLDDTTLSEFTIGYAPDGWGATIRWAEKKGFSPEQLETAGLIIKSDRPGARSPYYDRFRNRLMFPICDEQGRVIAFSGRLLDDNAKAAKYVNSPETPLFTKSRVLYGLHKARRPIVDTRQAIICEGQLDVIRCHAAGLTTAVAAQGTAFTEHHARIVKRYADSVVIAFDSDTAGRSSAIKAAGIFLNSGLAVRIADLPREADPDSLIREHGADAFQACIESAPSLLEFQINTLSQESDIRTEVGLMRVTKAVLATIQLTPNEIQRAKLIQEAAQKLNLPAEALHSEFKHLTRRTPRRAHTEPDTPSHPGYPVEEIELCQSLVDAVDHPELVELINEYLPQQLELIQSAPCRAFLDYARDSAETGRLIKDLIAKREQDEISGELTKLASKLMMEPAKSCGRDFTREKPVQDSILRLWQRHLRAERAQLDADSDADKGKYSELTVDLKTLDNWIDGEGLIKDLIALGPANTGIPQSEPIHVN